MAKISVIVPCYNEEKTIAPFTEATFPVIAEMQAAEPGLAFELIFVDDGSSDGTLKELKALSATHPFVKYISFSRNFGKEAAMFAGLSKATGDYVAIMDADLQDPPALLKEMYAGLESGEYDCVASRRVSRKGEPAIRSFFARRFYGIMRKSSDANIVDGARDYRMMTRQMTDAILQVREYNRFSKGIFSWVGFRTKWLEYENVKRVAGETKWSFWKLFKYSIEGIVAFSTKPLNFASVTGVIFCILAFIGIIFTIVRQLIFQDSAFGWPSLVCIILLISGVQLFCIGILGQYLAKTYLEVKDRPIFIIREDNLD